MLYVEAFALIIQYVAIFIQLVGLSLVVGSVLFALYQLPQKAYTVEDVRVTLASRILFSLEFLIAADILLATLAEDIGDITRLGGIVLIRVMLGYAIHREIKRKK